MVDLNFVMSFLIFVFEGGGIACNTVQVYRSALVDPLSVGYGIDFNDKRLKLLLKSMWLKKPNINSVEPKWNLDLVLNLVSSNVFNINISKEFLVMKCIFLLAMALGNRISEFHALLRGRDFISFSRNFKSVTIIPNASFLAKNEGPLFRRSPMKIIAILNRDGSPHALCPVNTLRNYLDATRMYKGQKLFVNPETLAPCNKGRIVFYLRKLIRISQPSAYVKFHDCRILSSWQAFWSNMSWSNLRAKGFWKSNAALSNFYLRGSVPSQSACVALGRWSH